MWEWKLDPSHPVFVGAVAIAAVLTSFMAIRTSRTPPGATAWVVFILALPPLGIPIYAIFGYANYWGFTKARRASDASLTSHGPAVNDPPVGEGRLGVFERLSDMPVQSGNGCELLVDGKETYDALIDAIGRAERYVLMEFYTIRADWVGQRFKAALIDKAREGVAVYVLHDSFRAVGLPRGYANDLRKAGVRIKAPRGPRRALGRLQMNFRTHRKMVVVDGTVGFTGGLNIGKEYLGQDPKVGAWRDTFVRLTGPIVSQLQHSFVADWLWSTGDRLSESMVWDAGRDPADLRGLMVSPSPTDVINSGNMYFIALACLARRRLWIATPYFVPDTEVLAALKLAALRGVEVRVLVPDKPDHYMPWVAAFSFFDGLREVGGEIWRYTEGFLHQKVVLVDDDLVSVGTINLDIRSGILNFEQTAILQGAEAGRMTEEMLRADFARAYRMDASFDQQPKLRRVAAQVTRLLAPVL